MPSSAHPPTHAPNARRSFDVRSVTQPTTLFAFSTDTTVASICCFTSRILAFFVSRKDGRRVLKGVVQNPNEEENHRNVHHKLQRGVADNIARLQLQNPQQRQHPKRMNEISERF